MNRRTWSGHRRVAFSLAHPSKPKKGSGAIILPAYDVPGFVCHGYCDILSAARGKGRTGGARIIDCGTLGRNVLKRCSLVDNSTFSLRRDRLARESAGIFAGKEQQQQREGGNSETRRRRFAAPCAFPRAHISEVHFRSNNRANARFRARTHALLPFAYYLSLFA